MSVFLSLLLQAAAPQPAIAAQETQSAPEDLRIVCRTIIGTGSRLNSQRICLPKKEWRRLAEEGEAETRHMQDKSSRRGPVQ